MQDPVPSPAVPAEAHPGPEAPPSSEPVARRPPPGGFLYRTAYVLASGYILFFLSERLFWTVFRSGDSLGDLLITWLAYCAPGYVFLALRYRFRIEHWPAAFSAGTVYGWLVEGCLASTLYGTEPSARFPVSILCTAASWHALISALIGLHWLPALLRRPRPRGAVVVSTALGVFWGLWAPFQWLETPPVVTSVPAFGLGALAISLPLVACYWLVGRDAGLGYRPRWFGLAVSTLVLVVFYAQQAARLGLLPLVLLPALLACAWGLLEAYRRRRLAGDPAPEPESPKPSLRRCLVVLTMPLTATATYAFAWTLRSLWPALHVPIYHALTILGGAFLLGSAAVILWRALRAAGRARAGGRRS